jgi:hypothetical protein
MDFVESLLKQWRGGGEAIKANINWLKTDPFTHDGRGFYLVL